MSFHRHICLSSLQVKVTDESLTVIKYGHLVTRVQDFPSLFKVLSPELVGRGAFGMEQFSGPLAGDQTRHFLKRCPNATVDYYKLTCNHV
ncbi:hypothetical protein BG006_008542, partial [Podila minutissima]